MEFEWDKRKAATTFSKHAVRFEDAKSVFEDPNALELYQRVGGEDRWFRVGHNGSKILVVVYTETARGPHHFGQRGYQG